MSDELDATDEITFAAVGRALTRWESVEIGLADLYSIFRGRPFARDLILEFGRCYAITSSRVAGVEKAAPSYFYSLPNQVREGQFIDLMQAVQSHLLNRHRIAHGLVDMVHFEGPDGIISGYALVSPWYGEKRLQRSPDDAWSAAEINAVSLGFKTLSGEIVAFNNQLLKDRA